MGNHVLGLDIGGANLKAATPDRRAIQVPFALWKQPDKLSAALAQLVAQFPETDELAITMTGELCDCFETKTEGVKKIVAAAQEAASGRPLRVWSTRCEFLWPEQAITEPLNVAAANWHALASFVGEYNHRGSMLLVDIGSTTTDVIPIMNGFPWTEGKTDDTRLKFQELLYAGIRRTPLCALMEPGTGAGELFATTLDVYLTLGHLPEDPADTDTADGRPATKKYAHARLSRMLLGDPDITGELETLNLAMELATRQIQLTRNWVDRVLGRLMNDSSATLGESRIAVVSGAGEFLAREALRSYEHLFEEIVSLNERLGPECATCAPAYAVAVLAKERRL